jgi:(2Fe-2S) ferredoxin
VALKQHYLFVCNNRRPDGAPQGSCQARGSLDLFTALKAAIAQAGLAQEVARCVQSGCLGVCEAGPTILVEPDHFAYGHVKLEDVPAIVEGLRTGNPVTRLIVASGGALTEEAGNRE